MKEKMIMALKRAAAPAETAETNAAEAVKETVKEVENTAAAVANTDVKDDAPGQGELVDQPDAQAAAAEAAADPVVVNDEPVVELVKESTAEEIQPEVKAAKEVAVQPEGGAVQVSNTQRQANASEQFAKDMAAQGFEGLNLTGMSFDRVKLSEGTFQLGSEETDVGNSLDVNILSTREIYIVRQFPGNDAKMFYSYDKNGLFHTDGTSAQETLDEWKEDGYGTETDPLEIKIYIEAMTQLKNREDEFDEHMVSLSIPPASKDRLAGAIAVGVRKFNCAPGELILNCTVGKKIGQGEKAFRPWNFKAIGKVE